MKEYMEYHNRIANENEEILFMIILYFAIKFHQLFFRAYLSTLSYYQ